MNYREREIEDLARLAQHYIAQGQVLKAMVAVKKLVEIDPQHPAVQRAVSSLHPKLRALSSERPPQIPAKVPTDGWAKNPVPLGQIDLARVMQVDRQHSMDIVEIPIANQDLDRAFASSVDVPAADPNDLGLGTIPLFAALDKASFERLIKKLRIVTLAQGERLFKHGDPGSSMYIVSEGTVRVFREKAPKVDLARLDAGEFFGEIALITDHPRSASVESVGNAELIEIDREAVGELLEADPGVMTVLLWFLRDRLVDTLVRTSPLFFQFPYERRRALADRFQFIESMKSTPLIEQGQRARGLIIVLSGKAQVVRTFQEKRIVLGTLGPGDICGEMSLLSAEPAVATVTTDAKFMGLCLPESDFKTLVAQHPYWIRLVERIAEERRQKLVAVIDEQAFADGTLPLI